MRLKLGCGAVQMPWKVPICLLIVILGFVLFLYGANYYDNTLGWAGVGFVVGGIILCIVLKLLESVRKK
jgi:hypothetical protein